MNSFNLHVPSDQSFRRRYILHPHLTRQLQTAQETSNPINYSHLPNTTARNTHHLSLTKPKTIPTKTENTTVNELAELDFPGFGRVFNINFSWVRRFCWILILIIAAFVSIYQIYFRFLVFFYVVPAVVVRYESRDSFEIPRVTMCPSTINLNPRLQIIVKKIFNVDRWDVKYFFKLIEKKSLEEIWNLTYVLNAKPKMDVVEGLTLQDTSVHQQLKYVLENIFSPTGKCTRLYTSNNISYSGTNTFFQIFSQYHGKNKVEEYGEEMSNILVFFERNNFNKHSQYFMKQLGIALPIFLQSNVVLATREFEYISTRDYPCVSASKFNKCFENCINNHLLHSEHILCKLPYMSSAIEIRMCKTEEEFRRVYEATDRAIDKISINTCLCPRTCTQLLLDLKAIRVLPLDNTSILNLLFFFPDNNVERIIEYNSYTGDALLSDFGGSLGLYLGICVVSVMELLEVIVINVVALINHHIIH